MTVRSTNSSLTILVMRLYQFYSNLHLRSVEIFTRVSSSDALYNYIMLVVGCTKLTTDRSSSQIVVTSRENISKM